MQFLPFSLDEPDEAVKEIDVIMRVKINSIKMIQTQGYQIPEFEQFLINPEVPLSLKDERFYKFYEAKTAEMTIVEDRLKLFQLALQQLYRRQFVDPDDATISHDQTALVFFAISQRTGRQTSKALLVDFIREMGDNNYNVGIMITEKPLNVKTRDDIDKMTRDTLGLAGSTLKVSAAEQSKMQELVRRGTLFYHFTYDQLLYNVLDHYLQPKHTILDRTARQALINSGINLEDLSILGFENPVVRHVGAVPGDVIMISGDSLVQTGSRDYLSYKIVRDLPK